MNITLYRSSRSDCETALPLLRFSSSRFPWFLDFLIARSSILDFIKFTYFYFFDYISIRFLLLLFFLLHCLLAIPFSSCQSIPFPIFLMELFQANVYYANFIGRQTSRDYSSPRYAGSNWNGARGMCHDVSARSQISHEPCLARFIRELHYFFLAFLFLFFSSASILRGATVAFPWRLDR